MAQLRPPACRLNVCLQHVAKLTSTADMRRITDWQPWGDSGRQVQAADLQRADIRVSADMVVTCPQLDPVAWPDE